MSERCPDCGAPLIRWAELEDRSLYRCCNEECPICSPRCTDFEKDEIRRMLAEEDTKWKIPEGAERMTFDPEYLEELRVEDPDRYKKIMNSQKREEYRGKL